MRPTYSLHCSSFFWLNQFYIKDPGKVTPKRNYNGDYRKCWVWEQWPEWLDLSALMIKSSALNLQARVVL